MSQILYKYKTLDTSQDVVRVSQMLKGVFWFSRFYQQNDPMEGVYWHRLNDDQISQIRDGKNSYIICSFGSSDKNPTLWAYYTGGFKGVCIEVCLDEKWNNQNNEYIHKKIAYVDRKEFDQVISSQSAIHLIIRKLKFWKPENEVRLLLNNDCPGYNDIGRTKSITFGCKTDMCLVQCLLNKTEEIESEIKLKLAFPNDRNDGNGHIRIENAANRDVLLSKLKVYNEWRSFFER